MELTCYKMYDNPPKLVAGSSRREWMDGFPDKHPYRCLPMTMANSTGWELLCPEDVKIIWNGGINNEDITFQTASGVKPHWVEAHFRQGIVTFHPGYLFRTSPGWGLIAGGAPNFHKVGIQPLVGLVETDWLPFTFTMNWQLIRPCEVSFRKGEPFCFITPMEHRELEQVQPKIVSLESDPKLKEEYDAWRVARDAFNERLAEGEQVAVKQGWQRHYMKGKKVAGERGDFIHQTKRRLKEPIEEQAAGSNSYLAGT